MKAEERRHLKACSEFRSWVLKHPKAFPEKLYYGFDDDGFDQVSKKLFLGADEQYGIQEYLEILLDDNYGDKIMGDVFPEGLEKLIRKMKRMDKKK